jgi:hypothetical protein
MQMESTLAEAALKAGMDVKTAHKYRRLGRLPSEVPRPHTWRTREDPFAEVWDEARRQLELNPGLEAKTLFEALQRESPGRFADGLLRTFQRRVRRWRGLEGPSKEVFFAQVHDPGRLSQSDFTHVGSLGITLAGVPFDHLLYHFVLTYSNWETCTICFSESFESLCEGLQNALWELGGVPAEHQTDRLTSAVCNVPRPKPEAESGAPAEVPSEARAETEGDVSGPPFTLRYQSLLAHYGLKGRAIQTGKAHENGDVEQRHHRFKRALEQALLLRGSRDFADRAEYEAFLRNLLQQLNAGRRKRFEEELAQLRSLPPRRRESCTRLRVRVDSGSLIHVDRNVYSVNSRLIGEEVEVRLYAEHLDVQYAQKHVERIPRLRGRGKHHIAYRHIIDWLVRKPGAFENYRYREDLFPTSRFRMAYDLLRETHAAGASKAYLRILHLAAKETESGVDQALGWLLKEGQPISAEAVEKLIHQPEVIPSITEVAVDPVALADYDELLSEREVA